MSKSAKFRGPIVLDTSFLITLAGAKRANHDAAERYFEFWAENRVPMFLPAICAAEYLALDEAIPPEILRHVIVKPFTYEDAACAAHLLREGVLARIPGEDGRTPARSIFKDDVKIIGSAIALKAAAIATDDERTMCKYVSAVSKAMPAVYGLMALPVAAGFNRGLAELSSPELDLGYSDGKTRDTGHERGADKA